MKYILSLFTLFLIFGNTSFSQTLFNPNRFGFGYNFSSAKQNGYTVQTHTAYISTNQKDFFVSYSNVKTSENTKGEWGFGLNLYRIESHFFYPSLTVMFSGTTNNLGIGLGANLAFLVYNKKAVKIFPEAGVGINLLRANGGQYVNGSSFSANTDLNIGYYPYKLFTFTVTPGYIFSSPYSSLYISFGIMFTPNL